MKILIFFLAAALTALSTTPVSAQPDVAVQNALYDFIQKAGEITIYSIDPSGPTADDPAGKKSSETKNEKPAVEKFHGYTVFGKIAGTPDQVREQIRTVLISAVVSPEETYECFAPRIGVSLVLKGQRLDMLLCYQCHQSRLYLDGEEQEGPLGNTGEPQFNSMFDQRGIKRDVPKPRPTPNQN